MGEMQLPFGLLDSVTEYVHNNPINYVSANFKPVSDWEDVYTVELADDTGNTQVLIGTTAGVLEVY